MPVAACNRFLGFCIRQRIHPIVPNPGELVASYYPVMTHDLRYAIRVLLRSPGFALTAILSIGLGIGANTAIFSFVNAVLLRTLPVEKPEELVTLSSTLSPKFRATSYSLPFYQD